MFFGGNRIRWTCKQPLCLQSLCTWFSWGSAGGPAKQGKRRAKPAFPKLAAIPHTLFILLPSVYWKGTETWDLGVHWSTVCSTPL